MRLIGLLAFYEEDPSWLTAAAASYAKAGMDHLVALDGAYYVFPGGRATSGTEQHRGLVEVCRSLEIGLTLHLPQSVWMGNEVEKRSALFAYGEQVAEDGDWYVVIDADEVVTDFAPVKPVLEATDKDAAEVTLWERSEPVASDQAREIARHFNWPRTTAQPIRKLFRAIPGLRVRGNHYTYVTPDGRVLWGNPGRGGLEPAEDLTALRVEHRSKFRDKARHDEQFAYYERRDSLGIEKGPCARCTTNPGVTYLPTDWEVIDHHGHKALANAWVEFCHECVPTVREENFALVRSHGFDPDTMVVQIDASKPPRPLSSF